MISSSSVIVLKPFLFLIREHIKRKVKTFTNWWIHEEDGLLASVNHYGYNTICLILTQHDEFLWRTNYFNAVRKLIDITELFCSWLIVFYFVCFVFKLMITFSSYPLSPLSPTCQSPFGIPVHLRQTQTCLQDGWGCEIHLAHTTGTSPQAPLSGSLLRLWVKLGTPWCLRLCPWRLHPVRSLRWGLLHILLW